MVRLASVPEKGGKRSCKSDKSWANSLPNKSERVDNVWPNLIKLGPASFKARAKRCPGRPSTFRFDISFANVT